MREHSGTPLSASVLIVLALALQARAQGLLQTEQFDADPQWDARLNRTVPANPPTVTQDFGWRGSNNAGGSTGELGGRIERTTRPAWYADVIETRTFTDLLTADGRIALPSQSTGGAFHFGWFNSERQGWRPWSAMGFRLDGQGSGHSNVLLDYMTQTWKAGGIRANTVNPSYIIPHDNSAHTWQMAYDPNGNSGNGSLAFKLDNLAPVVMNLDPGHKAEGATFNRFGVWNQQTPSGAIHFFVDDVHYNGDGNAFGSPAFGWEPNGNNVSFQDPERRGANNFGYSNTHHAGGASPGEIGGLVWRPAVGAEPYYAAPTQQNLSFETPLAASGKVSLVRGGTDGGVYLGWFNKQSIENAVETQPQIAPVANFLAVNIEGPSRIGHYFRPVFAASDAQRRDSQDGPIIFPDSEPHDFTILYDPAANSGLGRITVTLDELSKEFNLASSDRAKGALFDHFGIFGISPDGTYVEMYVDDLIFTTAIPEPATLGALAAGMVLLLRRGGRR